MHRCGPEIFPQKIHPVAGKVPVCKDIFTRISVTASYGVEAKNQTNRPSNLDTNRTSLSGQGEPWPVPAMGHQQLMKEKGVGSTGEGHPCEEKNKLM